MKPIDSGGGGLSQTPEAFGAINVGNLDQDPSTATSNIGDIYYDTTTDRLKCLFNNGGALAWFDVAYNTQISRLQVVGTAVTQADTGTVTNAMIASSAVTNTKLSTSAVTDAKVSSTADIQPTKILGTAATLNVANTFTNDQTINLTYKLTARIDGGSA